MHAFSAFQALFAIAGAFHYSNNASNPTAISNIMKRGYVFDCSCTGIQLLNAMQLAIYQRNNPTARPPPTSGLNTPSQFTTYDEIGRQGWTIRQNRGCNTLGGHASILQLLAELQSPALNDQSWLWWQATIDLATDAGEHIIGLQEMCINAGIVIAINSVIPPKDKWPDPNIMHLWSDIAYLAWSNYAGGDHNAHNLKYVIQIGAGAPDTYAITKEFAGGLYPYPGRGSKVLSTPGLALLGTSNGCSLAWMILQHSYFQNKWVNEINLWEDPDGTVVMVQKLADSPQPNNPNAYNPPGPQLPGPA